MYTTWTSLRLLSPLCRRFPELCEGAVLVVGQEAVEQAGDMHVPHDRRYPDIGIARRRAFEERTRFLQAVKRETALHQQWNALRGACCSAFQSWAQRFATRLRAAQACRRISY